MPEQRPFRRCGVVAIGRNEGARLQDCLESVLTWAKVVVYVDSGSTDGSQERARRLGAEVVDLEMCIPFTAARARNEGFKRLWELAPDLSYVQFVDGDCEIIAAWPEGASRFLNEHPDVVAVCGRLRERFPQRSVYNLLCDWEWDTPVGEAKACGGNAMIRSAAFQQAGGYRIDLIAGEEPELCVRLRAAGGRIWRLDAEMALHDAAILRFGQWWRRTVRAGHAFAEGAYLHGAPPERHWVRESRSAWFWGAGLPVLIVLAAFVLGPWALLLLLIYPLQIGRLAARARSRRLPGGFRRASFLVLGKFAEAWGQSKFYYHLMSGRKGRLIEYK